ncbi:MAG: ADP-ribosylglycohydrolase family protein [Bacteroidales bacterium]
MTTTNLQSTIKSVLFGIAVGDALGVPVEFCSRQILRANPVNDMQGYGTYNTPAGTWSDDSALSFCLAECLTQDFSLTNIGKSFTQWYYNNYWTATGTIFDIGTTTQQAIERIHNGAIAHLAGGHHESDNGNGSLMRILPLLFYLHNKPIDERFDTIKHVSSITHAHIRAIIACFYYLEFAKQLHQGKSKIEAYQNLQSTVAKHLEALSIAPVELKAFDRLLKGNIHNLPLDDIHSSGYVIHTLEASIWCIMTTHNYSQAVLQAVNLGEDTDTTAAVTGGLAGLLYGFDSIPTKWLQQIARYNDIKNLAERLASKHCTPLPK